MRNEISPPEKVGRIEPASPAERYRLGLLVQSKLRGGEVKRGSFDSVEISEFGRMLSKLAEDKDPDDRMDPALPHNSAGMVPPGVSPYGYDVSAAARRDGLPRRESGGGGSALSGGSVPETPAGKYIRVAFSRFALRLWLWLRRQLRRFIDWLNYKEN